MTTIADWIAEKRALVAQATPGPWEPDGTGLVVVGGERFFGRVVADTPRPDGVDAALIATFHPVLLARLLDVVEAAENYRRPPEQCDFVKSPRGFVLGHSTSCRNCTAKDHFDRAIRALGEGKL